MDALKRSLARRLLAIGAIQTKEQSPNGLGFKLKLHETQPDAPLSPFYLNLRTPDNPKPGPLDKSVLRDIGAVLANTVVNAGYAKLEFRFDLLAGIPNAGEPLAHHLYQPWFSGKHLISLIKETGPEGRRIARVGSHPFLQPGMRVLLVDDLVTHALTKLEAIAAVEAAGLVVAGLIVLVDRLQGGVQELQERGYRVMAAFTIQKALDLYLTEGLIQESTYAEIVAYLGL